MTANTSWDRIKIQRKLIHCFLENAGSTPRARGITNKGSFSLTSLTQRPVSDVHPMATTASNQIATMAQTTHRTFPKLHSRFCSPYQSIMAARPPVAILDVALETFKSPIQTNKRSQATFWGVNHEGKRWDKPEVAVVLSFINRTGILESNYFLRTMVVFRFPVWPAIDLRSADTISLFDWISISCFA